jgi:hypothetical protein
MREAANTSCTTPALRHALDETSCRWRTLLESTGVPKPQCLEGPGAHKRLHSTRGLGMNYRPPPKTKHERAFGRCTVAGDQIASAFSNASRASR